MLRVVLQAGITRDKLREGLRLGSEIGVVLRRDVATNARDERATHSIRVDSRSSLLPPVRENDYQGVQRKCRTSTWGCCPAFSRCAAKTELCVTESFL
jgi:hypothetical protein